MCIYIHLVHVTSAHVGFVSPGLRESGCKFAFSGRKTQNFTLIHTNLASQIPGLYISQFGG